MDVTSEKEIKVKEESKACEHRDKVYLYTIENYQGTENIDAYRCLECQHIINVYVVR